MPEAAVESVASSTGVDMEEVAFVRGLRNAEENFDPADDEALLLIGNSFCEMYSNGASSEDINGLILNGMGYKYTLKQLISVNGFAVGALCPEHLNKLSAD